MVWEIGLNWWTQFSMCLFGGLWFDSGSKNGPTDSLNSKMGLLTNGPSSSFIHVTSHAGCHMATHLWRLILSQMMGLGGPGLGCTALRVFYDGKKTSQIALICDDFEENVIRFNLWRSIHDAARKRHGQNFMTNFQRSMTKLFRHEINGFL